MSTYYVDKKNPGLGYYQFWQHSQTLQWRWSWTEVAKDVEYSDDGPWRTSLAEAMRDAAADWESNGSPSMNRRFAGMLMGLATKAEKREENV